MSAFIVPNPKDPTQTYEFGKRGKRPDWIITGLLDGSIQIPEGYKTAKEKAEEASNTTQITRVATNTLDEHNKKIAKLDKKHKFALDKVGCAERRLADEKAAADALKVEMDAAIQARKEAMEKFATVLPTTDATPADPPQDAVDAAVADVTAPVEAPVEVPSP